MNELHDDRGARRGSFLQSVLRGVGWGAVLSVALALPVLLFDLAIQIDLGDGDICVGSHDSGYGIWLEEHGQLHCKLVFSRLALFWGFYALIITPLVALALYVRRYAKCMRARRAPATQRDL